MELEVNNSVPTGTAHVFDTDGNVVLEHGGVCTRLEFDKVESMSIDTFRRLELSKLKSSESCLHVVRNAAEDEYAFILGDRVLRYKLVGCSEVPLEQLLKELQMPKAAATTEETGLPWPMICKKTSSEWIVTTVMVPSMKRRYRCATGVSFDLEYWCPDIWFSLTTTTSGAYIRAKVCVVREYQSDFRKTQLWKWPLANVHPGGNICYGGANMTTIAKIPTLHGKIEEAMSMFFDAVFNVDLLDSYMIDQMFRGITLGDSFGEPYDRLIAGAAGSHADYVRGTLKLLWAMREPGGWRKLNLGHGPDAESFCNV